MERLAEVHGYDYVPKKWTKALASGEGSKQGTPLVGVELEMVFPDREDLLKFRSRLWHAQNASKSFERAVFLKEDGSLPETRSVECVFHPHHLGKLGGVAEDLVGIAHEAGVMDVHPQAGMHVHVSRPGLGLYSQGAVLLAWNLLDDGDLYKIAHRLDGDLHCQQLEVLSNPYGALLDRPGHYYRVDARRHETLEIRVFSGNVDSQFVLSRANVVQMVYGYAQAYPLNHLNSRLDWRELYGFQSILDWARTRPEYQEAVAAFLV